jgi:peroxiredoxin
LFGKEFSMVRRFWSLMSVAILVGLMASSWLVWADAPPGRVGKTVANFTLNDPRTGKAVSLADFKDKKAIVVVFMGTECPINNAYLPRLAQFQKDYAGKGVQFVAINANVQDTPAIVAEHARKNEVPFPVLKDEGSTVADQFGARRTPEAFVLDASRIIRYQGRIDDQYGYGYKRGQPTRRDLAEALDELLAGKPVTVASTPVLGCLIARAVPAKSDGSITYSNQVVRILQNRCQECHRPGQIGPFSLMSYRNAVNWSETIREVIQDSRMPPWYADPHFGKFANDRSLSQSERDTLLAWIDQGCPKGDDKDLPPARKFPEGWSIGTPDAILTMKESFEVPAEAGKGGIPYKYFEVETNFTEDKWVERAEAKAGEPAVVHHIVVFIVPPGMTFRQNDRALRVLCGTAPGDMPFMAPSGTAKSIPKGSKLVFQMHYTPNGRPYKDASSVGLIFAKASVEHRMLTLPILNPRFLIGPGDENYPVESQFKFKENGHVVSFMPHMHLRGKDFRYEAIYPDGKKETLLSVPRYNFNWQSVYRLAEPKAIPAGTTIHCVAHFDNSAKNPNNPDPTQQVMWGDQTWEEMMIGWMDFYFDKAVQ